MNTDDRWLMLGFLLLLLYSTCWPVAADPGQPVLDRQLRVCADSTNLPFSNQRLEGFENRLAELIARELHATVQYA